MAQCEVQKIDIEMSEIKKTIQSFYNPSQWHLTMVNGIDLGSGFEIQWVFANYKEYNKLYMYAATADYDQQIPTITDIIPMAWVSEAEVHDLLGAKIDKAEKGIFLDADMPHAPLRKK